MRILAGQQPVPLLSGERIDGLCVALDTKEGWVELLVKDPLGGFRMNGDELARERIYGDVGVIFEYPEETAKKVAA